MMMAWIWGGSDPETPGWGGELLYFILKPFFDFYDKHIKKWSFGEMWLAMEERERLRKLLLEKGFHLREEF